MTITNSISSGNGANGFAVTSDIFSRDVGVMNCDGCAATNNGSAGFRAAIVDGTGSAMRVARSIATNNTGFGFRQDNGDFGGISIFESLQGTNLVRDNGANRSGTITTIDPDAP